MRAEKYKEICALAETVRESLELALPIDLNEAVRRLGGTLCEAQIEPGKPEAMVCKTGERFQIVVRHHEWQARKRFSIAHELGHLFLHMGYLIDPDLWAKTGDYRDSVYHRFGYSVEEQEANLFAAAFLMPEKSFRATVSELTTTPNPLKRLAARFQTSPAAALRRGQELGLFR